MSESVDDLVRQIEQMGYSAALSHSTVGQIVGKVRAMESMLFELRKERDEARREVLEGMHPDLRNGYANAREWDCYNDEADANNKAFREGTLQ
jgi:hypothetical protein